MISMVSGLIVSNLVKRTILKIAFLDTMAKSIVSNLVKRTILKIILQAQQ